MTLHGPKREKAVALIMAVVVMSILAVVGFGFASSMKLEAAATAAIKNLTQARLAAYAALQLFPGTLRDDMIAEPSATAGPIADHFNETLCTSSISQVITQWGNLSVRAEVSTQTMYSGAANVRDESGKLDLNCAGNIVGWDYSQCLNDNSASSVDPAAQLYHRANQRLSSFEASFEQFFYKYYQDSKLWGTGDPYELLSSDSNRDRKARVRCANLARAICLYRYGGKRDGNSDGVPDYAGDGKPGTAGVDDDKDNDFGTNGLDDDRDGFTDGTDPDEVGFGNQYDKLDNDGDGLIDSNDPMEGVDEPDEFNPSLQAPTSDDRKFDSVREFKDAIGHSYSISGTDALGNAYSVNVPAAVNYTGSLSTDAILTEADRVYGIVQSELTVYSYSLDVRSVSLDDPGRDGYDNDGDGLVDGDDATGVSTLADLLNEVKPVAQGGAGKTIYQVNINERDIEKPAQAAYIYLKLTKQVTYKKADGTTFNQSLVKYFNFQNALDIVDFRDTDCVPTKVRLDNAADAALLGITAGVTYYGMEGLHVTEVGRYIKPTTFTAAGSGGAWQAACTLTVPAGGFPAGELDKLQGVITIADTGAPRQLKPGAYMLRLTVTVPANGTITFADSDGASTKIYPTNQGAPFYFGPLKVDANNQGTIKVLASNLEGPYSVAVTDFYLPYVEIMNWSRQRRDMTRFTLKIGPDAPPGVSLSGMTLFATTNPSNGEALEAKYIPGHKTMPAGYDSTKARAYYGHFVIVYDMESFEKQFGDGSGTWGDTATEDFPIAVPASHTSASDPFFNGLNGTQGVTLYQGSDPIAGGPTTDDISSAHNGAAGLTLSTANIALGRAGLFSDANYGGFEPVKGLLWCPILDASRTTPSWSPGRWNITSHTWWDYLWPTVDKFTTAGRFEEIPVLREYGYFANPGAICRVAARSTPGMTFGYSEMSGADQKYPGSRPNFSELLRFTVSRGAPGRININTASLPVLAACLTQAPVTADWISANRPFINHQVMTDNTTISGTYYDPALVDDDGDNAKNQYSEKAEWLIRWSAIIALDGKCFSAAVTGSVKDGAGNIKAKHAVSAVFDRGRGLTAAGEPEIRLLAAQPASQ